MRNNMNATKEIIQYCIDKHDLIYDQIHKRGIPYDDWDDLFQDLLVQVYRSGYQFAGKSSIATWVYRVVSNLIVDYYRKADVRERLEKDHRRRSYTISVDEPIFYKQMLMYLPNHQRIILDLRFRGESFHEIADDLGLTYEAARMRYRRGIAALQAIAKEESS